MWQPVFSIMILYANAAFGYSLTDPKKEEDSVNFLYASPRLSIVLVLVLVQAVTRTPPHPPAACLRFVCCCCAGQGTQPRRGGS